MSKNKINGKDVKRMFRNIKWIIKYPKGSNTIITVGAWSYVLMVFTFITAIPFAIKWWLDKN